MILKALYDLAVRENLDPFYEPKGVTYLIHVDQGGRFLRILEPLEEAPLGPKGRSRGKPRPPKRPVPRRSARTVQDSAEFLVDKAEYIFGVDARNEEKRKKEPERPEARRKLFRERIKVALADSSVANNDGLRSVLDFLEKDCGSRSRALSEWLSEKAASDPKALEAGLFAFVYAPDGGAICVHEHPDVRSYWAHQLNSDSDAVRGQCLVTGAENAALSRLHAAPKGIPPVSLTKGGVPLTSVNKDAFRSYGLEDVGCAPISAEATQRVDAALTRLLDPAYPGTDGNPMPRRCVTLTPNTILVYWAREDASLDFIAGLDAADPEQVSALLHSPYKGRPAAIEDASGFYALVLSGTQGRGIVRSFVESTVRDVAVNVERYFADARITRPFSKPDGTYPILDLRRSLVFEGDLDRLPPDLAVQTYVSILRGRSYPRILLEAAVRRNRVDLFPKRGFLRGPEALAARCSLIKAFLVRNLRREVPVSLDARRPEPAYRLGRLLAVVDKLQADALGSVNATIVDRYYGSASSTPAAVMPTLLRRCQHHLGKLRREKPGWAVNQEKLLQEVMGGLERFPPTLTLEEQGLFALGFYHQRQAFYVKKEGAVE
jgi:CRISPR-associated protein Csd1